MNFFTLIFIFLLSKTYATAEIDNKSKNINSRNDLLIYEFNLNFSNSESQEISINVPENSKSIFFQMNVNDGNTYNFTYLLDPNNHPVMGKVSRSINLKQLNYTIPDYFLWENISFPSDESGLKVLVPNNSTTKLNPGNWRFKIKCQLENNSCSNINHKIQVLIKKNKLDKELYRIPIRLFFSGYGNINARNYYSDSSFKDFWKAIDMFFRHHGFKINILSAIDVKTEVFKSVEDACRFTKNSHFNDSINVYFVAGNENWVNTGGATCSSPGSFLNQKGFNTGVIIKNITKTSKDFDPNKVFNGLQFSINRDGSYSSLIDGLTPQVFVHEVAHFLGLLHVCEGGFSSDEEFINLNLLKETKCDKKNLMFPWANEEKNNIRLTEEQLSILLGHPIIY